MRFFGLMPRQHLCVVLLARLLCVSRTVYDVPRAAPPCRLARPHRRPTPTSLVLDVPRTTSTGAERRLRRLVLRYEMVLRR